MSDLTPNQTEAGAPAQGGGAVATGENVTWRRLQPRVRVTRIDAGRLPGLIHELAKGARARLADLFGAIENGQLVLRAVYAFDEEGEYLVVEWLVDGKEYPQLSDVAPAAFLEECEVYEQFGVRRTGARSLTGLWCRRTLKPSLESVRPRTTRLARSTPPTSSLAR